MFQSDATDLIAGITDVNGCNTDVFAYDVAAGSTSLVSISAGGLSAGNNWSDSPVLSDNGQIIAFRSFASDLATPPTNGDSNIFVRDLQTGVTTLVSVNAAGTGSGNNYSDDPSISGDGRYVAFESSATDLATPATNGYQNIFVRDLQAGTTALVSVNTAGDGGGDSYSYAPVISADGSLVAFYSYADNLAAGTTNPNNYQNVYLRTGKRARPPRPWSVPTAREPPAATTISNTPAFGWSSTRLVFQSAATDLIAGIADINGSNTDVFAYDVAAGTSSLVSVKANILSAGNNSSDSPVLSDDGQIIAFRSYASDLVANDLNGGSGDVFVRDLQTGVTTLVSVNAAGTGSGNSSSDGPSISGDGRYVAFESYATDLATPATNGYQNIFVRDLQAGTTTLVSIDTAGDGGGDNYSYAPVISADGSLVAFYSYADNLAAGTTNPNNYQNVYLRNWQAGTPTTTMVSANSTGTTSGNNNSNTPAFGWSSTRLVFQNAATDLIAGIADINGSNTDVFAYDVAAGSTSLVSVKANILSAGNNSSDSPVLSDDGQTIAFRSSASDLVANDLNGGSSDVFMRNLQTGVTTLVSVNAAGTGSGNSSSDGPSISGDGRYVAFESYATDLAVAGHQRLPEHLRAGRAGGDDDAGKR